jgi:cysteine desulfurase family protein (TIGR01976 family)
LIDIQALRRQFPALNRSQTIFFDGAAGTQIAARTLERMNEAMVDTNANFGGLFDTSVRAVQLVNDTRAALKDFFHAFDEREIVFGQNMTTLTFAMSRALGRCFKAGDEIVLTRMDHDANVSPWLTLAADLNLTVRWLDFDISSYQYDLRQLDSLLNARTRLVAVNYASNVIGTINDVAAISRRAKQAGALVFVDAVQYAPHGVIDVQQIGCDFLVCSAYKFYGPHYGILWGRLDVLESITPYKVRPASEKSPDKFETGTKSREAIAGILGSIEHFEALGAAASGDRRARIVAGMTAVKNYEDGLTVKLLNGLSAIAGVTIHGITTPSELHCRVPTVAFTMEGREPAEIAKMLAAKNINVWHGHNYGVEPVKRLGLIDKGGVVRVSLAQYNTVEEIEMFLEAMTSLLPQ